MFLEDFWINFDVKVHSSTVKRLLRDIFENESNSHLKGLSLKRMGEVFVKNQKIIRKSFLEDFLLEIDEQEEWHILITQIKYLFLIYKNNDDIILKFKRLIQHENADVSSEAFIL